MESARSPISESPTVSRETKLYTTVAYYVALVVLGMGIAVLGPTLPALADQTGTELRDVSFLFVARSVGGFLGALLAGHAYDRYRGHPLLVATLISMGLVFFLIPLLPWLWLLSVALLLMGISEGMLDVGANTLIVWVHGRKVGPFMSGLHFFFGVGAFIAPIIIAQVLLHSESVRWGYWILAFCVLPVTAWLTRLPSPVAALEAQDEQQSHMDIPLVILIALFLALYVGAEVGFGGWIFSYAVELDLAPEASAAYLTSAFWGAFTIGRLLAIPAAAYLRPRLILLASLLGALASLSLLLVWQNSLVVAWIAAIGMGLALAPVFPTALSLAERRMVITGRVTSWFFVGASLGAMSLPWLMGQLFAGSGPTSIMVALTVDLLLATGVFAALLLYSQPRRSS